MTFMDKLRRLRDVSGTNYWAGRLYAELCYMACLSSTKDRIYDARLEEGDLISARGYGRIKVLEFQGESRRGRQIVTVFRYGK